MRAHREHRRDAQIVVRSAHVDNPVDRVKFRPRKTSVNALRISNEETCYRHAMTFAFRIIAWVLTAAVTFATLGPPQYRPHLGLGQDGEHALAFVLVGLAFGLAYPRRRLLTAGIAVLLIGLLELLQHWMPGRHARWEDFVVDALAAWAGIAAAAVLERMMRSKTGAGT
jgi:hypothetical protein